MTDTDITNQMTYGSKFNRLMVLMETDASMVGNERQWIFLCDCGVVKIASGCAVRRGRCRSCGCLHAISLRTHGMRNSTEYRSWRSMKDRCRSGSQQYTKNYADRGITICDRWRDSFENFIADMGLKPTPTHSVDRIDNDNGYSPENCRWATPAEQGRNTRNTVNIEIDGETLCVSEWAKKSHVSRGAIKRRLLLGQSGRDLIRATRQTKRGDP